MKLSDSKIKEEIELGNLIIEPLDLSKIKGITVPLTLGNEFIIIGKVPDGTVLDPYEDNSHRFEKFTTDDPLYINPNELILGVTKERVEIGDGLCGRLDGRSRLARLGLAVHITAHRIDPDFKGNIVLEIYNHSPNTLLLKPHKEIGALLFERVEGNIDNRINASNSTYIDQSGARL